MSNIRKQSILSSVLIYIGFAFGFLNTYLFAKQGIFKLEEYGLIQAFISIGLIYFSLSNMGSNYIMAKMYPYYYDELEKKDNDLLALCLTLSLAGFIVLCAGSIFLKPLMIQKFSVQSKLLIQYFYWTLPFSFFYTLFFILSSQSFINKKSVLPSFLQEAGFRIFTTILIVLKLTNLINFDLFIKLFAFAYLLLASVLAIYLHKKGLLLLRFKISEVTKKRFKEIITMVSYVYVAGILLALIQNIETLVITSKKGLVDNGIYQFSNYLAAIIAVPQRSIVSIASPFISQAWKDNNLTEINRIYRRSSINLLIAGLFIFINIWLNMDSIYQVLNINKAFEAGKWVVLVLGIKYIIDLGTGVNSQILQTSPSWRMELLTNALLFILVIPLNIYMIGTYGITGAAISSFIYLSLYNLIKLIFIKYKYNLFPFEVKTFYAILSAIACFLLVRYIFIEMKGWGGIILKSSIFSMLFISAVYLFKLTPDAQQILYTLKKKLKRKT